MLREIELLTEEELKGKVAIIRCPADQVHGLMNQINAFQNCHPELGKVFSFMVLPPAAEIRDVKEVAQEIAGGKFPELAPIYQPKVKAEEANRTVTEEFMRSVGKDIAAENAAKEPSGELADMVERINEKEKGAE